MRLLLSGLTVTGSVVASLIQVLDTPEFVSALSGLTQVPVIVIFVWAFMKLEDKRSETERANSLNMIAIIESQHELLEGFIIKRD